MALALDAHPAHPCMGLNQSPSKDLAYNAEIQTTIADDKVDDSEARALDGIPGT